MCDHKNPLFDYKRMVYGGFKVLVDLQVMICRIWLEYCKL
jgi:hypothetical protein